MVAAAALKREEESSKNPGLSPTCTISSRNQPISSLSFWGFSFSGKDLQLGCFFAFEE